MYAERERARARARLQDEHTDMHTYVQVGVLLRDLRAYMQDEFGVGLSDRRLVKAVRLLKVIEPKKECQSWNDDMLTRVVSRKCSKTQKVLANDSAVGVRVSRCQHKYCAYMHISVVYIYRYRHVCVYGR